MKKINILLLLAAVLCFGAAVFQVAIGCVPEWSAYWGAGEELTSNRGLLLGASLVVGLAAAGAGLYALSGAGLVRRLPLLRLGLFVIGFIFTLRGYAFIPLALVSLGVRQAQEPPPATAIQSSLVFLVLGLSFLGGLVVGWRDMSERARKGGSLAAAG